MRGGGEIRNCWVLRIWSREVVGTKLLTRLRTSTFSPTTGVDMLMLSTSKWPLSSFILMMRDMERRGKLEDGPTERCSCLPQKDLQSCCLSKLIFLRDREEYLFYIMEQICSDIHTISLLDLLTPICGQSKNRKNN